MNSSQSIPTPVMNNPTTPPESTGSSAAGTSPPRIESEDIFKGTNTVEIEHAGQRYLLRITRENKLILTK